MMAYLGWDKAETDRIEAQVPRETENGRLFTSRRGISSVPTSLNSRTDSGVGPIKMPQTKGTLLPT
jgi:hypothetical protein